ncbi:MAG: sugar-binding domain-containing protein, partial [Roseiflexaceae bacterium]
MQGATISLDGLWEFRRDDETTWQRIVVPGSWEHVVLDVTWPGIGWYRQRVQVPFAFAGNAVWLVFAAVSYHCRVFVDDVEVTSHTGMWDAFACDITAYVTPGATITVMLAVEKPASLTAGPDSPAVAGTFPLRSTLSGFLPYVWGHAFGGIWQRVSLVATNAI